MTSEMYGNLVFVMETACVSFMYLSVMTMMNWLLFQVFGNDPSKSIEICSSSSVGGNSFVFCCFFRRRSFALAQERQD